MKFLEAILGAELYSQVEEKINAHNGNEANKDSQIKIGNLGGGEYVSKLKYDDIVSQMTGKQSELDAANNLIADLKKGTKGNEELQGKVTAYETQVADLQAELVQTRIKAAVKVGLLSENAKDIDYLTYKIEEKMKESGKSLELDDNENIKGWDDLISGLKTQLPDQFEKTNNIRRVLDPNNNKLPNPNNDPATVTKEQFLKMGYNERLKLKQDNEALFKQLAHN